MIKKILKLRNVGLFYDACSSEPAIFKEINAIYADNGRGKSTLASVFRSCSTLDTDRLKSRQTIDSDDAPELEFLLNNGSRFTFESDTWSGSAPEIYVFDSEFVEENVCTGFAVRSNQKQSLLEFALGDTTVKHKNKIEVLSEQIQAFTRTQTEKRNLLQGLAQPLSVEEFISLEPVENVDEEITTRQRRIESAENASALRSRQDPELLQLLEYDVQALFDLLKEQIDDLDAAAVSLVNAHLASHTGEELEDWIGSGQQFREEDDCPFCGQSLSGIALMDAYRSYFTAAYQDLKSAIEKAEKGIHKSLSDTFTDALFGNVLTNTARIEAWKDRLEIEAPTLNRDDLDRELSQARVKLLNLVRAKTLAPLDVVGTGLEQAAVEQNINRVNELITQYNTLLNLIIARITTFKSGLTSEDVPTLRFGLIRLQRAKTRYEATTELTVNEFRDATNERNLLNEQKAKEREQLDELMRDTLAKYQERINELLNDFGAGFSICNSYAAYRGSVGRPQYEYALKMRNKEINLGREASFTSGPNFSTLLGDSDKRTLAFAFFIARLEGDAFLSSKIVVLDDPVTSMDRNRRHQTIRLISKLAGKCDQLMVLSHDAYFIQQFQDELLEMKTDPNKMALLQIEPAQNDYSKFGDCDLAELCSSEYFRNHVMVADYADRTSTVAIRYVAVALRPLLEGYLHRRFPAHIPRRVMLGKIISDFIEPANSGPLLNLTRQVSELKELNRYARTFHHDSNPTNFDSAPVVDGELITYARKTLDFIYKSG